MRVLGFHLAVASLLVSGAAHAGWTQQEGHFYFKGWGRAILGDRVFVADGSIAELPASFFDASVAYHFEYGLTGDLTIAASGNPLGVSKYGARSVAYTGPLQLAGRYALLKGTFALAAELQAGFGAGICTNNVGRCEPLARGEVGGQAFTFVPTIPRRRASLVFRAGYAPSFGWIALSAGADLVGPSEIGPAVNGSAQVGVNLPLGFVIDLHSAVRLATGAITHTNVTGVGRTSYVGLGLGLSWWIVDTFGLALGVDTAPYARANAASPSFMLGVELRG